MRKNMMKFCNNTFEDCMYICLSFVTILGNFRAELAKSNTRLFTSVLYSDLFVSMVFFCDAINMPSKHCQNNVKDQEIFKKIIC